jgi:aspartate/methionine/tyrosine aminotransferase
MGVALAKAEFISWILRVKTNVDSGMFRPMMKAAAAALGNPPEYYRRQNEAYRVRRIAAEQIMNHLECAFDPDQSGLFLWGRIPDRYPNCEALTEPILQRARVFLTPGFIFGHNGERYVRISLCAPFEKMQEALLRMQREGL